MVTAGEQDDTREFDHTVVDSGDGFHVKVVSRLIDDQDIGSLDHHAGEENTHFLTTGKDTHFLYTVISGKEHSAEEAADIGGVLDLGELCQPFHDREIGVEDRGIIFREVGLGGGNAPFVASGIRFHFSCEDLKERTLCKLVSADKRNLVFASEDKGNIVEDFYAVDGLGKIGDRKHFVSNLAVRTEIDVRIFPAGRFDLVKLDLFKSFLSGSSLLGFGSVRGEAGDEVL